jgi:hypothetical protein
MFAAVKSAKTGLFKTILAGYDIAFKLANRKKIWMTKKRYM